MSGGWKSDIDLKALAEQVEAAAGIAVLAGADKLLDLANERVPVESGGLKASGRTSSEGTEAAVSYGEPGARTGFEAIMQHEHTEYHHPNGGQAKFLEQPMLSDTDAIRQAIVQALREEMGT